MKTFDERKKNVENYMQKIQKKRRKTAAVVTSVCLVAAVLAAVLFVPYSTTPPDVRMYAGSEYYTLIQRLNEATYKKPAYANNFQALLGSLSGAKVSMENTVIGGKFDGILFAPGAMAPNISGENSGSADVSGEYVETTDNQVDGVIEADILKRSTEYIYYLRGAKLTVYSIDGENSAPVGSYTLQGFSDTVGNEQEDFSYYSNTEMYLSQDCRTVTVLREGYSKATGTCTVMVNLDVSDPAAITEKGSVYFTGSYLSSRAVDGDILLTYNYAIYAGQIDFDDPATFVPRYGTPGDMTCIPADNIVCPENVGATRYTVLCKVDGDTLAVEGSAALLSYSQSLYVSGDTIYATHSYSNRNSEIFNSSYRQTAMTEITGVSYVGDGLEILGTIAVEGSVKNQYSMDQYDGILRVVTSTTVSYFQETFYGEFASSTTSQTDRNVNLYCIDLFDWTVAASVIAFAPEGEDAQSVRFDGVNAYVCTAEVITFSDPVYFFDLSDLEHITWTDTGTIDGYSTSLIQLDDGYLLGVGYGQRSDMLKIEVYEQRDGGVASVCVFERLAAFSEDYKAYLVDRENDLFGLALLDYQTYEFSYILLHFDGYSLNEIARVSLSGAETFVGSSWLSYTRGVLIDGYLYVFSNITDDAFSVTQIR